MQLGEFSLGYSALGEITDAGAKSPIAQVWDADYGVVFLYRLTAFMRNVFGSWIVPLGTYPLATVPAEASVSGSTTLNFSDVSYISGPADSLISTPFEGVVDKGLRITRTLPSSPEASRRVNLDLGSFTLANNDGEMDSNVANFSVDGRRIQVLLGLETYKFENFFPIFTGRMIQWNNSMSAVSVKVRDEGYRLDVNLQSSLYDGSGGYNGGSDLTGKPRPVCFGQALNIAPPLINATSLVYQFHSRLASSVDAVYDRGAALIGDGNDADYATLIAAVIVTGHFRTCLALGLVRLGSTPSGLVTMDVKGDAQATYVSTAGEITSRILQDFGGLLSTEIDTAAFSSFATAFPGIIGWYQGPEPILVSAVMDAIFGSCCGWWGAGYDGMVQCGRLTTPNAEAYTLALDELDVINFEILDPLAGTFPPRYRQRVGYQKLWTTQQDTDLAGAVTASRRSYLSQEYRLTYAQDLTVPNSFLLATDPPPLVSLFYNSADAQTLADALLALYKVARQTIRVTVGLVGIAAKPGSSVLVTFPRLNTGSQTPMLVMDVTLNADKRQVELILWG